MKIGVIADIHAGYRRGNKTTPSGWNVRESDIIESARCAVSNLVEARVDAILDLGDIAHVPHPSKRALLSLVDIINGSNLDWYSANGNHTLQRTSSDAHLYEVLANLCPRFWGFWKGPALVEEIGAYLVPYDTASAVERALAALPPEAGLVAGHWACEDADWPGEHVKISHLPLHLPVVLGHWHTRNVQSDRISTFNGPIYIGATDRLSWGEANNPTGVAIYDTGRKELTFIDHQTRPWIDIRVSPDDYLEDAHYEQVEGAIVRVRITSTPEQFHSLDLVRLRKKLAPSLEHQILRSGEIEQSAPFESVGLFSIRDNWQEHVAAARLPRGIDRAELERIGLEALE